MTPKSLEVPVIDENLRYSGGYLLGVAAQVIDMPLSYLNTHPDRRSADSSGILNIGKTCSY
ncbi:hypothetical protein YC2023_031192 [Brassica napus]